METIRVLEEIMSLGEDGWIHASVTTELGTAEVMALPFHEAVILGELNVIRDELERSSLARDRALALLTEQLDTIEMNKGDEQILGAILFESAVMSYARCFDANGKQGYQLDIHAILGSNSVGLGFHDFIYSLRQRHIGHDINSFRNAKAGAAFFGTDWALSEPGITTSPDRATMENLGRLIGDALAHVNAEMMRLRGILMFRIKAMDEHERAHLTPLRLPAPVVSNVDSVRRRKI